MLLNPRFCDRLRYALYVKGWTPRMLARKMGVNESQVSRWLAGESHPGRRGHYNKRQGWESGPAVLRKLKKLFGDLL